MLDSDSDDISDHPSPEHESPSDQPKLDTCNPKRYELTVPMQLHWNLSYPTLSYPTLQLFDPTVCAFQLVPVSEYSYGSTRKRTVLPLLVFVYYLYTVYSLVVYLHASIP